MHSFDYEQKNKNSTTYVTIHHNGDFSGDVRINTVTLYHDEDKQDWKLIEARKREIAVPFEALKQIVAIYVQNTEIEKLESASTDELLDRLKDN